MLWLRNQLIPILSANNWAKWNFPQKPNKCFLGTKCQNKEKILRKMEIGSHFRGSISNVMAKKSTEIKFKYKIAVNGIFSQKHYKCFLGTKCQRWPYLEKNGIWLTFKGPNVECYGSEINWYKFWVQRMVLNAIFHKNQKNVSWGQTAKNGLLLRKMAFGSHLRGNFFNVIA